MVSLTIFKDPKDFSLMQTSWASHLNPVVALPQNSAAILPRVILTVGSNVISHRLGRKLQGWSVVRKRSAASIYDNQDQNAHTELTLILISDSIVTVDLEVF